MPNVAPEVAAGVKALEAGFSQEAVEFDAEEQANFAPEGEGLLSPDELDLSPDSDSGEVGLTEDQPIEAALDTEQSAEDDLEADIDAAAEASEEVADAKPTSKAQQRIRQLANTNKELRDQFGTVQKQLSEQQQAFQYQMWQMQQQQAAQMEQWKHEAQRAAQEVAKLRERDDDKNLSELQKWERDILRTADKRTEEKVQGISRVAEERIRRIEAQYQAQQEAVEKERRFSYYSNETKKVRDNLLTGFEEPANLSRETDEMLLAYCGAFGLEPSQAAPYFKKYLDRYHQAKLRADAKQRGVQVKKAAALPKAGRPRAPGAAPNRPGYTRSKFPAPELLRKNNYDNYVDWVAAGEPPLG